MRRRRSDRVREWMRIREEIEHASITPKERLSLMKRMLSLPTCTDMEKIVPMFLKTPPPLGVNGRDRRRMIRWEEGLDMAADDVIRSNLLRSWLIGSRLLYHKLVNRKPVKYDRWVETAGGEDDAKHYSDMVSHLLGYELLSYTGLRTEELARMAEELSLHLEKDRNDRAFWKTDPKEFFENRWIDPSALPSSFGERTRSRSAKKAGSKKRKNKRKERDEKEGRKEGNGIE